MELYPTFWITVRCNTSTCHQIIFVALYGIFQFNPLYSQSSTYKANINRFSGPVPQNTLKSFSNVNMLNDNKISCSTLPPDGPNFRFFIAVEALTLNTLYTFEYLHCLLHFLCYTIKEYITLLICEVSSIIVVGIVRLLSHKFVFIREMSPITHNPNNTISLEY